MYTMRGFEPERVGALRKAAGGSFLAPRCAEATLQARLILPAKAAKSPLEHQNNSRAIWRGSCFHMYTMRGFEPERVGALRKAAGGSFLAPRCAEATLQARLILPAKAAKSPLEHQNNSRAIWRGSCFHMYTMRGFEPERVGALRKAAGGSFLAPRCAEATLQARLILPAKAAKSPLEHQ